MMSCQQVTRAAGDFIERRLHLVERLKVLAHIAMCRGCRTYVEQFRLTLGVLHSVPQPVGSAPSADLLEHFRRHVERRFE